MDGNVSLSGQIWHILTLEYLKDFSEILYEPHAIGC